MISIIIPTYNEEKYIESTLLQIKSKLKVPYEIIVSDDKSTDDTVNLARNHAHVVLTTDEKHRTIAANRNKAAARAKHDLLVFIDGDSHIEDPEGFFTRALARFENEKDLVAITGSLRVHPESATLPDRVVYSIFNFVHFVKNNILHVGEASGKFQMIRRSAFEQVGGFRADLVTREDGNMFWKLSKVGRTAYDNKLKIYHSGRRAHRIGWLKLLSIWFIETLWVSTFNKALSKEWKAIR